MTNQTDVSRRLGGSPAGFSFSRLCTFTLAATLFTGASAAAFAQAPAPATPATPPASAADKKPATEPAARTVGNYMVHQSLEVGGRYTTVTGSQPMWDTLVNQTSGGRILGQSLEMHSINNAKTPFFDSLTTYSTGYGGDPFDVTRFRVSKGRLYDFNSSFRRDRNYFDYNLLVNSLLGPNALVAEPDSLHLFNTVRRNTDTSLTLLPLSIVSFRAGYNHGTHEGPSYTTLHDGGDVQLLQWFRNAADTYSGGVDVKLARRTTLSYDQFYVDYKGDSSFSLAGANYTLSNGTPVSLGVDTLATATCGTGTNKTLEVVNGVANAYCSGTTVMTEVSPTRTTFPTEQVRFSSRYWDKVYFNGRYLYSAGTSNVTSFNETFTGLLARTFTRQEIDTGGLPNGAFAQNRRINNSADVSVAAELSKYFSLSDTVTHWNVHVPGMNAVTSQIWAGTAKTANLSMLTPLSTFTPTTTTTTNTTYLDQKYTGNTIQATATIIPALKVSGGWRFTSRQIADYGPDELSWHQNWLLLGAVVQPSSLFRFNINYEGMNSNATDSNTPSNTYTREAPNKTFHLRARATVKPAKWINFAISGNDYNAKNDDPLVNHQEHSHDISFATTLIASEAFSVDFNYAHEDVFSVTDICYLSTAPLPGAVSSVGTCLQTAANPGGSLPTTPVASQLYLGNGFYHAPSNFIMGSINYSPSKYFRFNGGMRSNAVDGTAEQLNPNMVPGALHSKYVTPYADLIVNIATQWAWHGNWTHDGYYEGGPVGLLPSRNTHGDIVTLGVKYAF